MFVRINSRILLGAVSVLGAILIAFAAGSARADDAIVSNDLPNGLRVIVAPRHTVALVAIDVWVRAGTRQQEQGQPGVAHFLEHLLFKGTPSHPSETDIDGAIEDLGGSLDAGTSYDWAHFYTVIPAQGMSTALSVMADALEHATISQASLDSERPVIMNEIERDNDAPDQVAGQMVRGMIYGPDHPYGQSITGTAQDVTNVTRDEVVSFYRKYYVPSNVAVVIAGDVTPDQATKAVATSFGSWTGAPAPSEEPLPTPSLATVSKQIVREPANESYLVTGFTAPAVSDKPNVWAMDVLLTYIGQGAENALDDDLRRSKHLVTAVTADFLTQRDTGLLTVTLELPTASYWKVRPLLMSHLTDVRNNLLTDDELNGAKQELLSSYLFDTETDSGKADALGFYEMIDSYRYDAEYVDHIKSVTAEQVRQVAQTYLTTDAYAQVMLEPPQNPELVSAPAVPAASTIFVGTSR